MDNFAPIAKYDLAIDALDLSPADVATRSLDGNDAAHFPVTSTDVLIHQKDKIIHSNVSTSVTPLLSVMEKGDVVSFPLYPECVDARLCTAPKASHPVCVSGCDILNDNCR